MANRGRPTEGRPTGPKRVLSMAFLAVLAVTLLFGPPVVIVSGVINLSHANQIRAHGVAVTATVLHRDEDYDSPEGATCWGASVSYVTAGGTAEQSDLHDRGGCMEDGDQVRVVYDPAAPNVVQLASDRGNTGGGWDGVIMGSVFTVLFWGVAIWGLVTQRRPGVRPRGLTPPVHGDRGTATVSGRQDA
jgi:Protein of unknown function (DUF3592)